MTDDILNEWGLWLEHKSSDRSAWSWRNHRGHLHWTKRKGFTGVTNCFVTLTIWFTQWLSGYLLLARHPFNEPFFDQFRFLHLCDQSVYVAAHPRATPLALWGEEDRPVKWNVLNNRQASCWEYQRIKKKKKASQTSNYFWSENLLMCMLSLLKGILMLPLSPAVRRILAGCQRPFLRSQPVFV